MYLNKTKNNLIMSKIYLIHAVEIAIKPIKEAFESHWPEAELVHLWDETLSIERAKTKHLPPFLNRRIEELVKLAIEGGADAIMFTCSAFGSAIERAANNAAIPVLKPNQAMFEKAIALSGNIGMLGSFAPAIAGMEEEFYQLAAEANPNAKITSVCISEARDALKLGNVELHNQAMARGTSQLAHTDVLLLAHFSSAPAAALVAAESGKTVLSSPMSAVQYLKTQLSKS